MLNFKEMIRLFRDFEKKGKHLLTILDSCENQNIEIESQHLRTAITNLCSNLNTFEPLAKVKYCSSQAYIDEIRNAFKKHEIPLIGVFPMFKITPFELFFDHNQSKIFLNLLGQTINSTKNWDPLNLSDWVSKEYKRIVVDFNDTIFLKDLLEAYRYILQFKLNNENGIRWGRSISLKEIYSLLTISQKSRREYSKEIYAFYLGKVVSNPIIQYKEWRFEFGPPRDQRHSIDVYDLQGNIRHLSTLTIHHTEQ